MSTAALRRVAGRVTGALLHAGNFQTIFVNIQSGVAPMTCGHEVWLGLNRGVLTVCSWCQSCVVCRAVVLDGHIAVNFNTIQP
mgnify:CR=1 FL=1